MDGKHKIAYIIEDYNYFTWINNRIRIWGHSVNVRIHHRDNLLKLTSSIAEVNGYTAPIPNWLNQGIIVGLQGGTAEVKRKYLSLKSYGTKIKALWLQDWVGKRQSMGYSRLWWNWELDQ